MKFYFLLRFTFGFLQNVAYHFAFDASTVGMNDRMLGVISAKGRPAAPLPPQVLFLEGLRTPLGGSENCWPQTRCM